MLIKVVYFSKKKLFLTHNLYNTSVKRSELACLKKVFIVMSYGPFFHPESVFRNKNRGYFKCSLKRCQ